MLLSCDSNPEGLVPPPDSTPPPPDPTSPGHSPLPPTLVEEGVEAENKVRGLTQVVVSVSV